MFPDLQYYGNGDVCIVGIMVMVMFVSWVLSKWQCWYRGYYVNYIFGILGNTVKVMLLSLVIW